MMQNTSKYSSATIHFLLWIIIFATGIIVGYCLYHTLRPESPFSVTAQTINLPLVPSRANSSHNNEPTFVPDFTLPLAINGMAPVIDRVSTSQPVVFLGIDDGAYKDQSVVKMMKEHNIKASLYLSKEFIKDDPDFFKQLVANGSVVENHSLSHDLEMIYHSTYEQQRAEICGMSAYIENEYKHRPLLFRPPGGAYNEDTQRAAHDCGIKAIVNWVAKANGGSMQYQAGDKLQRGDIVLMHFRPEFKQDMEAFIRATKSAGLRTELLETALQ